MVPRRPTYKTRRCEARPSTAPAMIKLIVHRPRRSHGPRGRCARTRGTKRGNRTFYNISALICLRRLLGTMETDTRVTSEMNARRSSLTWSKRSTRSFGVRRGRSALPVVGTPLTSSRSICASKLLLAYVDRQQQPSSTDVSQKLSRPAPIAVITQS